MHEPNDVRALEQRRYQIMGEMAALGDLVRGKLSKRFQRCGKKSCHCWDEGHPGHGPYYILNYYKGKRQTSRSVRPGETETVKQQVAAYGRLSKLYKDYLDVSTRLCDARRLAGADDDAGEKKKPAAAVRGGPRG